MNEKGFTLIELLAVVIVLSILVAIAVPKYFRAVERSRASGAVSVLGALARSQARFKMEKDHFTNDVSELDIAIKDTAHNNANATGNTFEDKFFTFTVTDNAANPITTATRKEAIGVEVFSLIVNYDSGKIVCEPAESQICQYLGLKN